MARTGRPKGQRQTTKSSFVRLTEQELAEVEAAIEKQIRGIVGARITVAGFLREVGLREARKINAK